MKVVKMLMASSLMIALTGCVPNGNLPTPVQSQYTIVSQEAYDITAPEYIWIGGNECISLIDVEPAVENMTAGALAGIQIFCDENRRSVDYGYQDVPGDTGGVVIPSREGGLPWKVAFFSVPVTDLLEGISNDNAVGGLQLAMETVNAEYKYCVLPPSVPGNSQLAQTVTLIRGMIRGGDTACGTNWLDPDDYGITVGSVTSMLLTDTAHQDLAAAIEYFISLHP